MAHIVEPPLEQILRYCAEDPVERVFLEDVARRGLGRFAGVEEDGRLVALCHTGANVVPSGLGCGAFADVTVRAKARMLIGEQRAIVSDQAGTTRDYLSAELNWHGLALELIDTAGVDGESTGIAAQAEQLRQWQVEQADLVVWCSSMVATEVESRWDDGLWEAAVSNKQ